MFSVRAFMKGSQFEGCPIAPVVGGEEFSQAHGQFSHAPVADRATPTPDSTETDLITDALEGLTSPVILHVVPPRADRAFTPTRDPRRLEAEPERRRFVRAAGFSRQVVGRILSYFTVSGSLPAPAGLKPHFSRTLVDPAFVTFV